MTLNKIEYYDRELQQKMVIFNELSVPEHETYTISGGVVSFEKKAEIRGKLTIENCTVFCNYETKPDMLLVSGQLECRDVFFVCGNSTDAFLYVVDDGAADFDRCMFQEFSRFCEAEQGHVTADHFCLLDCSDEMDEEFSDYLTEDDEYEENLRDPFDTFWDD